MKVSVIGCSTSWTNRPTSSYCINDTILVDCGNGTFKYYDLAKVDYKKIKHIFITHFHVDHTFDLLAFYIHYKDYADKSLHKTVTIYGPKGLHKYLEVVRNVMSFDDVTYEKLFNVVEIDDFDKKIKVNNLEVTPYRFFHETGIEDIGYVFDDGEMQLGFTGDFRFEESNAKFIEQCQVMFFECCDLISSKRHTGYDIYSKLEKRYPNKKFLAIHCSDNVFLKEKELGIECAKHGTIYDF